MTDARTAEQLVDALQAAATECALREYAPSWEHTDASAAAALLASRYAVLEAMRAAAPPPSASAETNLIFEAREWYDHLVSTNVAGHSILKQLIDRLDVPPPAPHDRITIKRTSAELLHAWMCFEQSNSDGEPTAAFIDARRDLLEALEASRLANETEGSRE